MKAEFVHPPQPGGPVIADFTVTPANINSDYHIVASDDFKTSDSTQLITVRVSFKRLDGSWVVIASKDVYFKRNVLNKLHLTLPDSGRAFAGFQLSEFDWTGNETIDL